MPAVTAAASDDPDLNALQYAVPLVVILICSVMLGGKRARRKRHSLGPSVLAAES